MDNLQENNFKNTAPASRAKDSSVHLVAAVVGIVAVCFVLYVVFGRSDPDSLDTDAAIRDMSPQVTVSKAREKLKSGMEKKLPVSTGEMQHPSFSSLKGTWVLRYGVHGIAELKITEAFFELVTTEDQNGALRHYSRGDVMYDQGTGKLSLIPTREAGAPVPIEGVLYRILTMRAYDVYAKQLPGDDKLYLIATNDQFMAQNLHPLFAKVDFGGAPVLMFYPLESVRTPEQVQP